MKYKLFGLSNLLGVLTIACLGLFCGCQTTSTTQQNEFLDYQPVDQNGEGQADNPVEASTSASSEDQTSASKNDGGYSDKFRIGDVVAITFSGTSDEIAPHQERIKEDGTITLFLVGSVKAAGKSPGELQKELQKDYERFYKTLVVTVQSFARYYYVGGEVKRPGAQEYVGETTVTKAIQSAGDFTDFAKKNAIKVIRNDGTTLTVNYGKLLDNPRTDPPIYPGDNIHVPRRILW